LQIRGEPFERRLLFGLWRACGRQHVLGERSGDFEGVARRAGVPELAPHEPRAQREHGEAEEHGEVNKQKEKSHKSCWLANTETAPRTVRIRRGRFGSSSIAARMREMWTSIDRSNASSASPLTRSMRASLDKTRPALSASATSSVNW